MKEIVYAAYYSNHQVYGCSGFGNFDLFFLFFLIMTLSSFKSTQTTTKGPISTSLDLGKNAMPLLLSDKVCVYAASGDKVFFFALFPHSRP